MDILPVKLLTDEDAQIFGSSAILLAKLQRVGLPVASSIIISPPQLKLKTVLEHFDFGSKEVFEQSLTMVAKEIKSTPIPELLLKETNKKNKFFALNKVLKSKKELWLTLLEAWLTQIKERLWKDGFHEGITQDLDCEIVVFLDKIEARGSAYFDPLSQDIQINTVFGTLSPNHLKIIDEIVKGANKKLFLPYEYDWILDGGIKLIKVRPFNQNIVEEIRISDERITKMDYGSEKVKTTVKVFLEFGSSLVIEEDVDGAYISSEKIFDLNRPKESFENLLFRLVETAITYTDLPVFLKLADISEGMGKIRGAFRLLHQKSLFDPLIDAILFVRDKKNLTNIYPVIPFVRSKSEFLQIKRELAIKGLTRKSNLKLWLELSVPENIINLEEYLLAGIDGVVLNLDELVSYLNGFDLRDEELIFYKNEVEGMIKFLEDSIKLLHKSKIPFIAYGSVSLYPKVLEFLVEKGVYGIVVERYEAYSVKDLLHQTEHKIILRRS